MERERGLIEGVITRISGPVVRAKGMAGIKIRDMVYVGELGLIGEVIEVRGDEVAIQVYEETDGLTVGEPVRSEGKPFLVELGPGLLGSVYDGIQRPLEAIREQTGNFIRRGATGDPLPRDKKWGFHPLVKPGDPVEEGDFLGWVQETPTVKHYIMVPPGVSGRVAEIQEGEFTVTDVVARLEDGTELTMMQTWPIRQPRPARRKVPTNVPMITGTRILDVFFPVPKGGNAIIPGPFGSGKCVWGACPVLLGDGRLVRIRELFEAHHGKGRVVERAHERYTLLDDPIPVFAFDPVEGRVTVQPATAVYQSWADELVEVRTRSGRAARVTPVHKLLTLGEDLELREVEARRLRPGDFIVAPRALPVPAGAGSPPPPASLRTAFLARPELQTARVADPAALKAVQALLRQEARRRGRRGRTALAAELGVSPKTLENYEKGRTLPTLGFVRRLYEHVGRGRALPPIRALKTERRAHPVRLPERMTPELAEFLGLVLGDGSLKPRTVAFYNDDPRMRARFRALAKRLFGLEAREGRARTVGCVHIHSQLLVRFLEFLGVPRRAKARTCRVPEAIFQADEGSVARFVGAYFACDGYSSVHPRKGELEIATASEEMAVGLSYLLLRLGVVARLAEKRVRGRGYHRVLISGRDAIGRFLSRCRAAGLRLPKLEALADALDKGGGRPGVPSVDVVPLPAEAVAALYERFGRPYAALKRAGVEVHNYLNGERLSVEMLRRLARVLKDPRWRRLAQLTEHVFFDEVVEVRRLPGPHAVYDLTVPGAHTFVGGLGPMVLHNTVTQQSLAKWSDADIVIYIGCGERGNEMTEVLTEFPHLEDPRTGAPLMNRTILIANTSNMPVAARETSIYTGITLAEYYRDMGYDVALMADSTSRWAEALREISGRLEEMPGEEGYPPYLASRIAEFYERSGRVVCLGRGVPEGKRPFEGSESEDERSGSVTVIGAVSPPGGDFSEPVTQNSLRIAGAFWALDAKLAYSRHFPAINWLTSYSLYVDALHDWFAREVAPDYWELRRQLMEILQKEDELSKIVQLVGKESLSDPDKLLLDVARSVRDDFLRQSAFHEIEAYCPPKKAYYMMKAIVTFYETCKRLLGKVPYSEILKLPGWEKLAQMRYFPNDAFEEPFRQLLEELARQDEAVQVTS